MTSSLRRRDGSRAGYLFVLPYVVLLAIFGIGPSIYAIYISLINTKTLKFAGISNYRDVLTDFRFVPALVHVLIYVAIWLPLMLVMVLALALILHARPGRLSASMRVIYYLPSAITGSANVLIWLFIMDPSLGPFKWILQLFGWKYRSDSLAPSHLPAIYAVMAFTLGCGSWIVIMYGALQNISTELLESARMDGANAVQLAWYLKLPLMGKYVSYMLILMIAGGLQLFVEPQLVYSLAKAGSPWWSLNQLAYYLGFQETNLGAASALSVLLLILGIGGALLVILRTKFFSTEVPR